jgi:hypothetical protein
MAISSSTHAMVYQLLCVGGPALAQLNNATRLFHATGSSSQVTCSDVSPSEAQEQAKKALAELDKRRQQLQAAKSMATSSGGDAAAPSDGTELDVAADLIAHLQVGITQRLQSLPRSASQVSVLHLFWN